MNDLKVGCIVYYIDPSSQYPYFNINEYEISSIRQTTTQERVITEIECRGYKNNWKTGQYFLTKNDAIEYLINLLKERKE